MKTFKTEQEKIQEICSILRKETLEPAQEEAQKIIAHAKERAEQLINEAHRESERLLEEAQRNIEKERNVFHSSLSQASQQSLEALRQKIERKLFNQELHEQIVAHTANPQVIAQLIKAIINAIEKEGLDTEITAIVPATVSSKDINQLLGENVLKKLKDHTVQIGDFGGGAKIRLEGKRLTFEISDKEIEELLKGYVRKDFRKLFFGS